MRLKILNGKRSPHVVSEAAMSVKSPKTLAVIGSGPAGLMAAFRAAEAGLTVRIFEKRKSPGRKLLVAGSSGLNITYECALPEFARHYIAPEGRFDRFLAGFSPSDWRGFIERELGIRTFQGTSRRWFVEGEGMKASGLLKAWVNALTLKGVVFELGRECVDFECLPDFAGFEQATASWCARPENSAYQPGPPEKFERLKGVELRFADGSRERVDAACFALGGGSWEPQEQPLRWPAIFSRKNLAMKEFASSNVGFQVAWPPALLKEAEGQPIKNVVLRSSRGERSGDLVITNYGIEGTPVYFAGEVGRVHIDLKPDLSLQQMRAKVALVKENLSPIRRVKRFLKLGDGALALVFHLTPPEALNDLDRLLELIKAFPLELRARQPLAEAISSSGGLAWDEVDERLMLKRFPGVFVAGEMLDWDAPTGGFLLQGCVSQGSWVGVGAARWVAGGAD